MSRPEVLVTVSGLAVRTAGRELLHGIDLVVRRGERVGLIGESGSGKSLTALAVLGLLPPGLRAFGSVRLAGVATELLGAPERLLAGLRGRRVSMVFQEPMSALNPTMTVGEQVAEVFGVHRLRPDRRSARRAAGELLEQVGLAPGTARTYPHQLSGGQRQRVVLAIALAGDPDLLVLDEPTSALDVTVAARVLDVVRDGLDRRGAACLFISHDLAVVAGVCDRVVVMHRGRLVEAGPVGRVLSAPRHPYTRGLLATADLGRTDEHGRLLTMDGFVPVRPGASTPVWRGTPDDGWADDGQADDGQADDGQTAGGATSWSGGDGVLR